jgi:NAD(P)-dependent dehydrogenase (short-subunit alcohol dehydrogenase family)
MLSSVARVIQAQKTAVITGAASGVGFAVAKRCRDEGMHLALLDIDEVNLVKAKEALTDLNPSLKTEAYVLDVADVSVWEETARQIAQVFPGIDLVMLNAGKEYKSQGQDTGRLKPWLDGDYWKKV